MAIPAYGTAGTEVLYRTSIHAQADDPTAFEWDRTATATGTETYTVDTDHIITVLSISFCNGDTSSRIIDLYTLDSTNNEYISLLNDQTIGSAATFIWNDKFSLVAGDKLVVNADAGANIDCLCTYIDQVF